MIKGKRRWLPYLVYALLSLAVLGPLVGKGYILTLDMAFTPRLDYTNELYGISWSSASTAPVYLVLQLVSQIIPTWLLQKISLFLIFFVAGIGMHRLLRSDDWGSYFAGLLYVVNPFTYTRFLAGQWVFLAAYAVIPFAIGAFLDILERGGIKSAIKVALLSTLVTCLQIHGLLLLCLAFLIIFVVRLFKDRRQSDKIITEVKSVAIAAAVTFLLNVHWLLPLLISEKAVFAKMDLQNLFFFAPKPTTTLGVTFDVAALYGFWRGGYIYVKDILPVWWLIYLFILYLAIYGFTSKVFSGSSPSAGERLPHQETITAQRGIQNSRWVVISLGITGVAAFLLALGASGQMTSPIFMWLWENVSFFRGLRDSQKFVALLCLTYAYLGGLGVSSFIELLRDQARKLAKYGLVVLVVLALLTPIIYSFTMFGFYGQIGVTVYPREWYEVNNYLNSDIDDYFVLFLPWHLYMDYQWLPNQDKRLQNVAPQFFGKPIIAGDNLEIPGIYSQSTNPISKYVEFLLLNRDNITNLGELLAPLNIKYIILAHEADYQTYDFLRQQSDLAVVMQKENVTLFKNEHPIARAYGVNDVVYIHDLHEFLELSRTQDVMEHLYILGSEQGTGDSPGFKRLSVTKESPVQYHIEGTSQEYTVFTVPQGNTANYWAYDSKQSLSNLGFMPAFISDRDGGKVLYNRFYKVYLPSYIVSAATLLVLLVIWLVWHRRV